MRWIDADAITKEKLVEFVGNQNFISFDDLLWIISETPTVDAVPKSYANQIRWERDIAIEQLKEIGCSFGQKMDDVKKKLDTVPVVRGEWNPLYEESEDEAYACSICGKIWFLYGTPVDNGMNFCPKCGADMRKKVEE